MMIKSVEVAINNVAELLLGEESIPVLLRMHEGLDQNKLDLLVASIEYLIPFYRNENNVPKVLALAFLDISNHFYFAEGAYPEDELNRIEDAGNLLSSLANELFNPYE